MAERIKRHWFRKGNGAKPVDFADVFFISELEFQCEFGLRAFGEMQQAYAADKQHPALLALAHILLIFAGNVGKILGTSNARAIRLRATLGLEGVDFEQIRRARNYFEHFGERIERYVGSHEGLLVPRRVQDYYPEQVELDDGRMFQPVFLQFLNTTTLELSLYDQKFQLQDIMRALETVQAKARKWRESRKTLGSDQSFR